MHYTRRAERLTAKPVGTAGWSAFIAALVALIAAPTVGALAAAAVHPLLALVAGPIILVGGLVALVRLVLWTGQCVE